MIVQRYAVSILIPSRRKEVDLLHVSGYEKQKSVFVQCALPRMLHMRSSLILDKPAIVVNKRRRNICHLFKADEYEVKSASKAWRARHRVLGQKP